MRNSYEDSTIGNMDLDHYDRVQLKYDGMWVQVEIEGSTALVKTRKGNVKARFQLSKPYKKTVFVGEFMTGTQRSKGCEKALIVFDCSHANGWDVEGRTYEQRMEEFGSVDLPPELFGFAVKFWPVKTWPIEHAQRLWKSVESGDHEGLILRRNSMIYGGTVARVKPHAEQDYFATRVHWKNGKPTSIGGSLRPGGPEVVRARLLCGQDYGAFQLDKVFKCRGQELTKRGSMRFPMFAGWHLEK